MNLVLKTLSKAFDGIPVVNGISLTVAEGSMMFLIGPTGCGKSTVLKMVAGEMEADFGDILMGDTRLNDLSPADRPVALVSQSQLPDPQLTVYENVAAPLLGKGLSADEISHRVTHALMTVRMEVSAQRRTGGISSGELQKIILARALAMKPRVLLLDEPLSNLDRKLRLEMRSDIRRIQRETHLTALYVTQDQEEALSMADEIAIMNRGCLVQTGAPRELYKRPQNKFAAEFLGEMNWVEGTVSSLVTGYIGTVDTPLGQWRVEFLHRPEPGQEVWCGVRPECLKVKAEGGNTFRGKVLSTHFMGTHELIEFEVAGGVIWKAKVSRLAIAFEPGNSIPLSMLPAEVHILPFTTEES